MLLCLSTGLKRLKTRAVTKSIDQSSLQRLRTFANAYHGGCVCLENEYGLQRTDCVESVGPLGEG